MVFQMRKIKPGSRAGSLGVLVAVVLVTVGELVLLAAGVLGVGLVTVGLSFS